MLTFAIRIQCSHIKEYHSSIGSHIYVMKGFEKVDLRKSHVTTAVEFKVQLINLNPLIVIKLLNY